MDWKHIIALVGALGGTDAVGIYVLNSRIEALAGYAVGLQSDLAKLERDLAVERALRICGERPYVCAD